MRIGDFKFQIPTPQTLRVLTGVDSRWETEYLLNMKRTKSYISRKSKKSPGARSAARRQRSKWSPSEITQLRRLYAKHSNQEIARRLGRSLSSVISQAFKLRLKKAPERLVRMGKENIAHRWGPKPKTRRKK